MNYSLIKKRLIKFLKYFGLIVLVLVVYGFVNSKRNEARAAKLIQDFSEQNDPTIAKPTENDTEWQTMVEKDRMLYGILTLKDGSKVNYWFLSHHNSPDIESHTIFELPNKERLSFKGYFCCDVYFNGQPKDLNELLAFIKNYNGISAVPGLFD